MLSAIAIFDIDPVNGLAREHEASKLSYEQGELLDVHR
jgi:hypothetical protein